MCALAGSGGLWHDSLPDINVAGLIESAPEGCGTGGGLALSLGEIQSLSLKLFGFIRDIKLRFTR